ncbi:MAG: alpha/beta hydrolase [Gammaproteobacteria bacterium]|nr:alpha/beta hydrolase [Gammaproteobacteria bacterium]MDH3511704.1 alpha/beta hydrolase [Gammaproteobacteria bacterium]
MKETIFLILGIPAMLYLGLCIFLYVAQRSLLYQPPLETSGTEADEMRIDSNGVSLKVWHFNPRLSKAIIYFGGNAENVYWNVPDFREIFPDYSVYLINYRGYGGSSGSPSEAALLEDAVSIFDHLQSKHESISLIGRSLGTGVATYLASVRKVEKMVLVTPFDSLVSVAQRGYPIFPVSLFMKDRYDSIGRAAAIKSTTLVILAENDEIILRESSDRLISGFKSTDVLVEMIDDATHNSVGSTSLYLKLLNDFL